MHLSSQPTWNRSLTTAAPVVVAPVTTPTSAVIQWSVPVVTYSPEQYTVYYTTNSSGCPTNSDEGYNKSVTVYGLNHTDFFTIRDQQYNVILSNLHPYTVYCYKVVATNTEGRNELVLRIFITNESGMYCFYSNCAFCHLHVLSSKRASSEFDQFNHFSQ